ncbi:hypothetical protein FRC03_012110 [Tulasnella sp. 419]|nr:hypothetical protein FRC03_012110 [Tulasnella sp. 419]
MQKFARFTIQKLHCHGLVSYLALLNEKREERLGLAVLSTLTTSYGAPLRQKQRIQVLRPQKGLLQHLSQAQLVPQ